METKTSTSRLQRTDCVFSAPGKVFLVGEYAVLAGAPALVAAVEPRFLLSSTGFQGASETRFHPESPAGLLCELQSIASSWFWRDPTESAGGFGASTAQFSLVSKALEIGDWKEVLQLYRKLFSSTTGVPPSGADLVVQSVGGVVEFYPAKNDDHPRMIQRQNSLEQIHIAVIQASSQQGRKTATHEHLAQVSFDSLLRFEKEASSLLRGAIQSFSNRDSLGFGSALTAYANVLNQHGYEITATQADRLALAQVRGVMGVKGTGALQSDALIAVIDPKSFDSEEFNQVLRQRSLRLWSEKLVPVPGVRVES